MHQLPYDPETGKEWAVAPGLLGPGSIFALPTSGGDLPLPIKPRNLPPHWRQREPHGWGIGLEGRLITLSLAVSFFSKSW